MAVATTGASQAMASRITIPKGSYTDGQQNTDASVMSWTTAGRGTISRIHRMPPRRSARLATLAPTSQASSSVSGAPAHSTSWASGSIRSCGVQQVGQALLPGDPADEQDVRSARVDPVASQDAGLRIRVVLVGVDAVGDDLDPGRIDPRVTGQDVLTHGSGHRDQGVGVLKARELAESRRA